MESLDKRAEIKNLPRSLNKCFSSYNSPHKTSNRWMNIKEYPDWLNFQCY